MLFKVGLFAFIDPAELRSACRSPVLLIEFHTLRWGC